MMLLPIHITRKLAWSDSRRPKPETLARKLAQGLKRTGVDGVHQAEATVRFAGGSFLGNNLNPFTYVTGGSVDIIATEAGFELRCELGAGHLLFLLLWGVVGGTLFGYVISPSFSWLPLMWLAGVGGTLCTLFLLVGVPDRIVAILKPAPDEVPWHPS